MGDIYTPYREKEGFSVVTPFKKIRKAGILMGRGREGPYAARSHARVGLSLSANVWMESFHAESSAVLTS